MAHPVEIIEAPHHRGKYSQNQGGCDETLAPAADNSPQREGKQATAEARDQRAQRSSLAQRHCKQKRPRRLITERTNNESWNKKQGDGSERTQREANPEPGRDLPSPAFGMEILHLRRVRNRCAHISNGEPFEQFLAWRL